MEGTRSSLPLSRIGSGSLDELQGWIFTSIGVACFSLSFVTARLALRSFDPGLIALARGAGAGLVAIVCVLAGKYPLPTRGQIVRIRSGRDRYRFHFPDLYDNRTTDGTCGSRCYDRSDIAAFDRAIRRPAETRKGTVRFFGRLPDVERRWSPGF